MVELESREHNSLLLYHQNLLKIQKCLGQCPLSCPSWDYIQVFESNNKNKKSCNQPNIQILTSPKGIQTMRC